MFRIIIIKIVIYCFNRICIDFQCVRIQPETLVKQRGKIIVLFVAMCNICVCAIQPRYYQREYPYFQPLLFDWLITNSPENSFEYCHSIITIHCSFGQNCCFVDFAFTNINSPLHHIKAMECRTVFLLFLNCEHGITQKRHFYVIMIKR